jgi:hypothetical protein
MIQWGVLTVLSERKMRRVLYGLTGAVFVLCGGFAVAAVHFDTTPMRVGFMLLSVLSGALMTASLFAVFVAPLAEVYRHGYEASQHACQQQSADLRMVIGQRARVVPLRVRDN